MLFWTEPPPADVRLLFYAPPPLAGAMPPPPRQAALPHLATASFFMFQLGRPLIVTAINLVMIAVQMGACFVLIPRLGAEGAALASSATYVLGASLNTWRFCRATGLGVADVWIVRADDIRRVLAEWPGPRFGLSKT